MKGFFAVVLLALTPGLAAGQTVRFHNVASVDVTLKLLPGSGPCDTRIDAQIVTLRPGQVIEVGARETSLCYIYSFLGNPSASPVGGGEVRRGESREIGAFVFDDEVKISRSKLQGEAQPTAEIASWDDSTGQTRESQFARLQGLKGVDFERSLATWVDPTTPPQSMTECVQEAWGDIPFDGQWRTCTGWATRWRCMRRELVLVVSAADGVDVAGASNECLQTAAVAGALAGVVAAAGSAGAGLPAAESAFIGTLKACLAAKLSASLLNVRVDNRGGWTNWGGC